MQITNPIEHAEQLVRELRQQPAPPAPVDPAIVEAPHWNEKLNPAEATKTPATTETEGGEI